MRDRPESWPVHEVEDVWSGPAPFSVRRDIISAHAHPDVTFGRLVIDHPGAVIVLALDDEERALVVEQYRHPPQVRFVELPRDVHPYYVSTQAHPELLSRPTRPHPLFAGLIGAAIERQRELELPVGEAARAAEPATDATES